MILMIKGKQSIQWELRAFHLEPRKSSGYSLLLLGSAIKVNGRLQQSSAGRTSRGSDPSKIKVNKYGIWILTDDNGSVDGTMNTGIININCDLVSNNRPKLLQECQVFFFKVSLFCLFYIKYAHGGYLFNFVFRCQDMKGL